jgi:WD40-like Beta Propeller Repeat
MLRGAALLAVALVAAGCGSSKVADPAPTSGPVKQYLVYEKLVGEKGVWIADAGGSNPQLLVRRGNSPVISPDGESVAYVGGCNAEDLCKGTYVVSTSGGAPRRVSSDTPSARRAAFIWSPDSKRVVVTRGQTASDGELVAIDVADGSESTLAKGYFYGVSFSPDGKQIVFAKATGANTSYSDGTYDLFVAESDGEDAKQITNTGRNVAPVWGPKSIAFSRVVWSGQWGRNEIWRVQPDGSERETITGSLLERFGGASASTAWCRSGGPTTAVLSRRHVDPGGRGAVGDRSAERQIARARARGVHGYGRNLRRRSIRACGHVSADGRGERGERDRPHRSVCRRKADRGRPGCPLAELEPLGPGALPRAHEARSDRRGNPRPDGRRL